MSTGHSIVTCGNHEPDAIGVHRGMQPEFNGTVPEATYMQRLTGHTQLSTQVSTLNLLAKNYRGFLLARNWIVLRFTLRLVPTSFSLLQ